MQQLTSAVEAFDETFQQCYMQGMRKKVGKITVILICCLVVISPVMTLGNSG